MYLKKFYQAIIVGGKLPGLLIAALLNTRGVDVLILDDDECTTTNVKGYELDLQILPSGKLSRNSSTLEVLDALAINLDNSNFFSPSLPFPQIIKSKHRLGFHGNRESIEDEFAREFPGEAYNIAQILWTVVENRKGIIDTLVKEKGMLPSFGIKAKLDSTIRRKKNTLNLQDLFQDNIKNSNCSTELKEIFSLAINYSTPLLTPHLQTAFSPSDFGNEIGFYPQGGMTGFKAHIKEKLKTFGVEIHPLSGIEKLNINKRELTGITIRGSEKQINASFLIYNSDLSVLHSLLPKNIFTKSFLEELTMKKVWGQWRTLFLLVEDDKIPVGMHSDLVIYREDKSPLIIQFLPKGNNELQGNDKRVIKVCTPMIGKKNPAESDNESIDSFEKATIEKLNELMPFLDKKIEIIYKHDNAPISKDDYIFSGSLKGPLNVGIMSPFTPFENLLIAGKEVITTLGLEGDFIQAKILSSHVTDMLTMRKR